ncbi:MAG: uncharacterized protein KVP18_001329 [Porospora cf. gigantea A]|nr:MAG: hypothetical protein KVP18_001329 [Porospora cf. gigantea A]
MGGRPASADDLETFAKALPRVRPFVVHVTPEGVCARELQKCPRIVEFHLDLARVLARDLDKPVDDVELFIPILEHDFCEAVERHLETTVELLGHNVVIYTVKGPPTSSELSTLRTRERRRWGGPLWQPSLWGPEYVIFPAVCSFDISVSESATTVACGHLPAALVTLVEALLKLPISELGPGSLSEIVGHHGLHESWTIWELYLLLTSDLSYGVKGTPCAKRYLKELLACQIVTKAIKKVALQEATRSREADWHNVVTSVLEVVMYQMFSNDVTQDPNLDSAAESLSVALWLDVIVCVTFLPVLTFCPDTVDRLLEEPPRRPYCFAQCLAHYLGVELNKQCLYRLLMHDPSVVIDDRGSMENQLYNLLHKPPAQQSRRGSFSRRLSVQYEHRKFADEQPLKEGHQCNQWMGCPQRAVPLSAKGFKHLHLYVSSEIKRVISAANLTSDTIVSKILVLNQRLEFWRPPGFEHELTGDSPRVSESKQGCFLELLPVMPCHSLGNIRYVRAFMSLQTCLHIIVDWFVNPPGLDDIIIAKTALSHLFNHLVPVASLLSDYTNNHLVPMRLLSQFYLAESLWLIFRVHVDALEEKRPVRRRSRRLTKPNIHRRRSSAPPPKLTTAVSDLKESNDGVLTHSRALGLLLTSIALDVRQSGRPDICFGRQGLAAKSMMAVVLAREVRMPELCALLVDVAANQAARLNLKLRATAGSIVDQIGQHLLGLELWDFPVCDELVLKNPSLDLKYVGLQPLTVDLKLHIQRSRISSFHLGHMPVLTRITRFSQTQRATQSAWVVGRNEHGCTGYPSEAFPRLDQLQLLPLPDTDVAGVAAGPSMSVVVRQGAVHLLGSVRAVHSIVNVEQVAIGDGFVVAKTSDGDLFSWGCSAEGALGLGSVKSASTPRRLAMSESIQHLAVGREHVCAVSHYGAMFVWGRADAGALGLSTSRRVTLPTQVFILEVPLDVPLAMWKDDSRVRELRLPPESEPVHISAHKSTLFCCVAASYYDEPPPDALLFSLVACGEDGTVCTDICGNVWLFGSYADQVEDQRTVLLSTSTCKIALAAFNSQPAAVAAGRKAIGVLDVQGSLWVAGSNTSGLLGCGDLKRSKQLVRSPAFAGRIVTCISFSTFASWGAAVVGGVCFVWGRDSPIDTPLTWKPQAVSQFPMHLLDIHAGGGHLIVLVSPRSIPKSVL